MRKECVAASLAVLLSQAVAGAAAAPVPMVPSGSWNVDFAKSSCVVDRPYGNDGAIKLILKPSMLGNDLEIVVARLTNKIGNMQNGKAVVGIAGKTIKDRRFTAYSTAKMRLIRTSIDGDDIDRAAIRGIVSVDAPGEGAYSFAIPGIERAMPVLAACLDQLRAIYKVSEAEVGALATEPKPNFARLFSTDDYPFEAVVKHQWGTVGALAWVEADGRVSSCQIIESNASPSLEQATCGIVQRRAGFTPATNAANKAVRAPAFFRIRWELPSVDF